MAKPIPQADVDAFRAHCHEFYNDALEDFDEGETGAYWTIETYEPFAGEEWEFSPSDDEHYDFYDLFEKVSDEFEFEEEGYSSFYMAKKE